MSGADSILVVDDTPTNVKVLVEMLGREGYRVLVAREAESAIEQARYAKPLVILLDVMMPGMDGLEVLRRVRARNRIPVLMLTARGDEADRVVGLELGADDYVPKPFSPRELLARLRAVLRRAQPEAAAERLSVAGIEVDVGARSVRVDGADIELTGLELDILVALMRRAGRVVPRSSLLSEAGRGDVAVSERTVDVHISKLRKKLNDDPTTPRRIRTVRGVGYVLAREP